MVFNPLFIDIGKPNGVLYTSKQTKVNNHSYLFSDIIRLLNDSSSEQNSIVPGENITDPDNNLSISPLLLKDLANDKVSILLQLPVEIVSENEETGILITKNTSEKVTDVPDSINLVSTKANLATFLEKLFTNISGSKIELTNVEGINNLAGTVKNENDKNGKGIKLGSNLIRLLKNSESLTLNIELLNSPALNFNNKKQLLTKVFNSDKDLNNSPEKKQAGDKNILNKELEKIASFLFDILAKQNSTPAVNIINQQTIDPSSVDLSMGDSKITPAALDPLSSIVTAFNPEKIDYSEINPAKANSSEVNQATVDSKEVNPASLNTIDTNTIYLTDLNVKDTIFSHLHSNKPLILNINLGEEKLKIEITGDSVNTVNNKLQTPGALSDQENLINQVNASSQETKIPSENIGLKELMAEKTSEKMVAENPATFDKITSEIKTGQFNLEPAQKFTLKITSETENEQTQVTKTLKEMLLNMGTNNKIEVKVLNPENKLTFKTETPQIENLVSSDKNAIVKTINSLPGSTQTGQNTIDQNISNTNEIPNANNSIPVDLVETVDNFTPKSQGAKDGISKTGFNSDKISTDSGNRNVVSDMTETPGKDSEQKPFPDKNEMFDQRISVNQDIPKNAQVIKNDTTPNILKSFNENSVTVKADNLMNEISRFLEQGESKSIVLKLKPDTLGKVKIVLDVIDKVVHANIRVDNENVKQMVQNNITALRQSLNLSGLQLSTFNVSLNYNESGESKTHSQKKKLSQAGLSHKISGPNELIITKSMGYNTYDYLI